MPRILTSSRTHQPSSGAEFAPPHSRRHLERPLASKEVGFRVDVVVADRQPTVAEIRDMNSLGMSFTLSEDAFEGPNLRSPIERVEIWFGTQLIIGIEKPRIARVDPRGGVVAVAFESDADAEDEPPRQLRSAERARTRSGFTPIAICADPFNANTKLHFRIRDLSAGGFRLETSLSNQHLIPGTELALQVAIPGMGFTETRLRISNAETSADSLLFGTEFIQPSPAFLSMLAGLAIFGVEGEGADAGLPQKNISAGYRVRTVGGDDDYRRILEVRLAAYRAANKVPTQATPESMGDEFDRRSLILYAGASRITAATARLVRCRTHAERFQFEAWFPTVKVPRRLVSCEISKLAVLPEHQGTDLVLALFRSCYEAVLKGGIEDVYCVSTKALEGLYLRLGARKLGSGFPHPTLPGETMSLFLLKASTMTRAGDMTIHCWEAVARDVALQLCAYGFVSMPNRKISFYLRKRIEKMILAFRGLRKRGIRSKNLSGGGKS